MRVKDARQTFLGVWMRLVLQDRPIEVWGGSQLRDLVYVDDVVRALVAAVELASPTGGVFNVGGRGVVSLSELAREVVALAGSGSVVRRDFPQERRVIDIGDYYADSGALAAVTGWRPEVALEDGLARTLAYFRDRLDRYL
jgi:nucleoside-diphosphate-sugar epimerase